MSGGDQGLLNDYFGDWATKDITKHLPFVYNTVSTSFYSYPPALKRHLLYIYFLCKSINIQYFIKQMCNDVYQLNN